MNKILQSIAINFWNCWILWIWRIYFDFWEDFYTQGPLYTRLFLFFIFCLFEGIELSNMVSVWCIIKQRVGMILWFLLFNHIFTFSFNYSQIFCKISHESVVSYPSIIMHFLCIVTENMGFFIFVLSTYFIKYTFAAH